MCIKGEGQNLTLANSRSGSKLNLVFLVFSETVEVFGTKFHMKAYGRMGMKIYIDEMGHMT